MDHEVDWICRFVNQDHCEEFFEEQFEIVGLEVLLSVHWAVKERGRVRGDLNCTRV